MARINKCRLAHHPFQIKRLIERTIQFAPCPIVLTGKVGQLLILFRLSSPAVSRFMLSTLPRILSKPRIAFLLHRCIHCNCILRSPLVSKDSNTSTSSRNNTSISINKMDTSREVDLRSMRVPYKEDEQVLLEHNLPTKDPLELFKLWFQEAKSCPTIKEPNAVCLTTATRYEVKSDGQREKSTSYM